MKLKRAGTDATPAEDEVGTLKRGGNNLIPAIVIAVGIVAAGFFLSQSGAEEPEGAAEPKAEAEEEPTDGPVQNLEAITLNLADGRFLKVGLALQLADSGEEGEEGEGGEELPSAKALDVAITLLGSYSMDELADPKNRELVKKKLSKQVSAAYVDPETHDTLVTKVYFTEFVMQ